MKNLLIIFLILTSKLVNAQDYEVCQEMPSSKNWTIIWGGKPSSNYGFKFMQKQAGYTFENENVLFADYQCDIEFCKSIISKFCSEYKIVSVYGFSRGGVNAWNQIGKVQFVGLIDPLIPENYNLEFDKTKVFMLYNLGIWHKQNQIRLEKVSEKLGVEYSKRLYMPHLEIPKLFFEKYKTGRLI